MAQFLDHQGDGTFLFYYTRPDKAGTPEFEHKVRVDLSTLKFAKKPDGTDDQDTILVECPCGCGAMATVPLTGGEEAQRLHAKHHSHKDAVQYITQAVEETMVRVKARGGEPRLDKNRG